MDLVAPNCTETILRDLVQERTGMVFNDDKGHLLDKLTPLVIERGFQSFLDYYYLLKYDAKADKRSWQAMTDFLTEVFA